jgi:ketosteroid isomerase-like protein
MVQATSREIRAAIAAASARFMAVFSRGDAAGVVAASTEDGPVLPPHNDAIASQQGIRTFWQGAMQRGIKAVTLESREVEGSGHTAYEVGRYTLQHGGGQVLDTGTSVVIWTHEAGQRKMHRDIWNSRRPAPGSSDGTART